MSFTLESTPGSARSLTGRPLRASRGQTRPGYLDPDRLSIDLDSVYPAAPAMWVSQQAAELHRGRQRVASQLVHETASGC